MVYNPVTGQSEPELRSASEGIASKGGVSTAFEDPADVAQVAHHEAYVPSDACGDMACGADVCDPACGDIVCGEPICGAAPGSGCGVGATFYSGIEFTFLRPHLDNNVAFTNLDGDAAGNSAFTDVGFEHDTELAPRVHFGWRHRDGVGLRATWWSFDHEADSVSASPDADGFGQISHPQFSGVDISTVIPTDLFSASADLEASAIDIEATQQACLGGWDLTVAGGVRYADVEQGYRAQTRDAGSNLRGTIDYRQSIDGIGPTISLGASRPMGRLATVFCRARGSVLFGDGGSRLTAAENIDSPPEIATTRTTSRDDLLSIGEVQVGFRWSGRGQRHLPYRPFLSIALEGQVWDGAGSPTSEDGALGFFGGTVGTGIEW